MLGNVLEHHRADGRNGARLRKGSRGGRIRPEAPDELVEDRAVARTVADR